ncbi:hypothetical protein ACFR9T_07220 [Halorubrum laminariae]|uniref:LamG domain-containing protein n=1 Tax=Halorubrum laminariae TaxID=1433523 RepID=A0ABD6BZ60_9EURY
MTGELSRFTSNRRTRGEASWKTDEDWKAGVVENVEISGGGLVPTPPPEGGEDLDFVTDNFEDGSLTEYVVDSSKDNGSASVVQSSRSLEGDNLARIATNGRVFALGSTSGLFSYPSAGDIPTFHVLFPNGDNNALYLYYGVQQGDRANGTGYRVTLRNKHNSMRLDNRRSGGTVANSSTRNIPSNEWLTVEVDWRTDGDHFVKVFDSEGSELGSMSGTDSGLTSGGIGYGLNNRNGNSSVTYVDFVGYRSP